MLVRDMNQEECRELLVRLGFGRLGCASNNQPEVVPIYFAYESNCLFGFSTAGQKIDWMRTNPLVCIDADEVLGQDNWGQRPRIWPVRRTAGQSQVRCAAAYCSFTAGTKNVLVARGDRDFTNTQCGTSSCSDTLLHSY